MRYLLPVPRKSAGRRPAAAALLVLTLAGPAAAAAAIVQRQDGDAVTYAQAAWVPWAVGAGAAVLLAAAAGAFVRLRRTATATARWVATVGLGLGGAALLAMALALPHDTLVVRPDGFTWSRGLGGGQVRYADCERVELVSEPIRGRFGVEGRLHTLRWHFRDGRPPADIPLEGPTMAGRYKLVSHAAAAGVGGAEMLVLRITTLR